MSKFPPKCRNGIKGTDTGSSRTLDEAGSSKEMMQIFVRHEATGRTHLLHVSAFWSVSQLF